MLTAYLQQENLSCSEHKTAEVSLNLINNYSLYSTGRPTVVSTCPRLLTVPSI